MKRSIQQLSLALAAAATICLPTLGQAASSANLLLTAPQVKEIDSRIELDNELANPRGPIVIQIYSSKKACQSCAQQREELIKVARSYVGKARFLRFDVELDPNMAPTVPGEPVHYFTRTGELTHTGTTVVTGPMSAADLIEMIDPMLDTE